MKTRLSVMVWALLLGLSVVGACGGDGADTSAVEQPTPQISTPAAEDDDEAPDEEVEPALQVSSPSIESGGEIPDRFTCEGEDLSPPLEWSDVGADSYVVLLVDPDADDFIHWFLYDIPGAVTRLDEAAAGEVAREGPNTYGVMGYRGPCPPGEEHRYTFIVYALDEAVDFSDLEAPSAASIDDAVACCLMGRGELQTTFGG